MKQTQGAYDVAKFYETQHDTRAAFIYYNEVVKEDPNSAQAQLAKKRIQELRPIVEALPGGIGPDGSGNPAVAPQKVVASNPQGPGGGPPDVPEPTSAAVPNAAPPEVGSAGALPVDPSAPVTSSSPGETAAADASMPSLPNATNAAPVAPVAASPAPAAQQAATPTPK